MTIEQIGIGAAPGDNTGDGLRTGMGKVNNNFSNSSHAASYLVGTATGQVLLSEDAGLDGGETNWTSGNMEPEVSLGTRVARLMRNDSGASINDQAIVPGSSLSRVLLSSDLTTWIVSGTSIPGSWRNVAGGAVSDDRTDLFVRVS